MADDVSVKFGADISDLKGKIDEVQGMFKTITERFAALAAVVAGGEAFKKFIDETIQLNSEALKLSKILGITGEAAGTLNTALGDIGADADTYTGAFLHFNRQLRQNSDEMKAMGVDVDALRSGQKDSNTVFLEAVRIIQQYKPGIDQTQAAMRLFGRSVEDVYKLQKLTNEKIAEAAEKNRTLNLVITQEGLAASKAYKEAINDVGDVLKGVSKTIGEAVIPHFIEMAKKFADLGPSIVQGMGAAIQIVITLWDTFADVIETVWGTVKDVLEAIFGEFFHTFGEGAPSAMEIFKASITAVQRFIVLFGTGLREVFNVIGTAIELLVSKFQTLAEVSVAALNFDWQGVKRAWQEGTDRANEILQKGIDKAVQIGLDGQKKLEKIDIASLAIPKGTAAGAPPGGSRTMNLGKQGGEDPRLAAMLALQKAQQEAALKLQLEFLKESGDIYDDAFHHNLISVQGYYDARLAIEKRANELEIGAKRQELADAQDAETKAQAKASASAKSQDRAKAEADVLKFKTEQVKIQGAINVLEAQGLDIARRNANERADAERKITEQLANISITRAKQIADNEVVQERSSIEQMKALRQISADQAFNLQKLAEDKSFAATTAALQAKRALIQGDNEQAKADRLAIDVQLEGEELQHQQRMTDIDRQAVLERKQFELQAQQSIQDAFAASTADFLNGQKSLWGALKSFLASTLASINKMIADTFAQKLLGSGSTGGGFVGGMLDMIQGFVGGRASGGPIGPGQWGIVGENGPEIAIGGNSGQMIIPNDIFNRASSAASIPSGSPAGSMGSTHVTVNNQFMVPAPTDMRTQQQIARGAGRAIQSAVSRTG